MTPNKTRDEADVVGAKKILSDYKIPSETAFVDIGNVYYAATQLEAAYDQAQTEISRLKGELIIARTGVVHLKGELNAHTRESESFAKEVASKLVRHNDLITELEYALRYYQPAAAVRDCFSLLEEFRRGKRWESK